MASYYESQLSGSRLLRCYELAPLAIRQYLEAEIEHVQQQIVPGARVLELGCGYGRILSALANSPARSLVGLDISLRSLLLGRQLTRHHKKIDLLLMEAGELGLRNRAFDLVCCLQNGISAFHMDQRRLIEAAVSATEPGGTVLFSSYAEAIWPARLEWFRVQSAHGLVGAIDEEATGNGLIVCKDGFRATTVSPSELERLAHRLGSTSTTYTVDRSSVFLEIRV